MPDDAPELTDNEIEHLARELLHLDTRAEVKGAVDIGDRILAAVYRGNFEAFQSRDGHKPDSVARLARACNRTEDWLGLRVKVAHAYPNYDAPFRDQVTFSHHVELLGAPEIERNQLLRQAAVQELTVRQLRRLIHPDEKPEPTPRTTHAERLLDRKEAYEAEAVRASRDPDASARAVKGWEEVIGMARHLIKVAKAKPKAARKKQ